jgi:hypothetical protein
MSEAWHLRAVALIANPCWKNKKKSASPRSSSGSVASVTSSTSPNAASR